MSRKSNRKQLRSRLESLFTEIEQDTQLHALAADANVPGWIWECDERGTYTACSPEVEGILGFDSQNFLGEKITSFAVAPQSRSIIRRALEANRFPAEVLAKFRTEQGASIDITLHIVERTDKDGDGNGWRGFAQVLNPVEGKPAPPVPQSIPALEIDIGKEFIAQGGKKPLPKYPLAETGTLRLGRGYAAPPQNGEDNPAVLAIPIRLHEQAKGLLEIVDENPEREWTHDERLLIEQVADQLSLALENANLFQQTQAALAETDVLYQASAELNAAKEVADVLEILRRYTILGSDAVIVSVNLFSQPWSESQTPEWIEVPARLTQLPPSAFSPRYRLSDYPSLGDLLKPESPTAIENVVADERLGEPLRALLKQHFGARSGIFLPLVIGGQWLGFLDGIYQQPTEFPDVEIRRLVALGLQAGEKIYSLQLNARVDTRRQNADKLTLIARQMAEILSESELRRLMVEQIHEHLNPEFTRLYEWVAGDQVFRLDQQLQKGSPEASGDSRSGQTILPEEVPDLGATFNDNRPVLRAQDWVDDRLQERYYLPWLVADQVRGVIEIHRSAEETTISDLDQEFVEGLVLQAASAIERARLFEQTQNALALTDEQARRLRLLNEMSEQLAQTSNQDEIFSLAVQTALQLFRALNASLSLISAAKDTLEVRAVQGKADSKPIGARLPIEVGVVQRAVEQNQVAVEAETPPPEGRSPRSHLVGPLFVGGGVIGVVEVEREASRPFDQQDQNFTRQLLSLLASALENRRLFEGIEVALSQTEEQARRLAVLNEMSEKLSRVANLTEAVSVAAEDIYRILPADYLSITLLDPANQNLIVVASQGEGGAHAQGEPFTQENSLIGDTAQQNRVVSHADIREMEHPDAKALASQGIRSLLVTPLQVGGEVIGTINLGVSQENRYDARDENMMVNVGSILASTIENRQLFEQIERRSLQLQTSAEVSRSATSILDPDELFAKLVDLIRDGFGLYYVGLFLVDQTGEWSGEPNRWAVLRAGTGEPGRVMVAAGHKLEVGGESMIGSAIASAEARIALDVGEEAVYFRNPYLPNTRSEMALPLVSRSEVLGALTIQSEQEAAFGQEDITALQTLSDQIANAIENARLFEQTQLRAEELAVLNEMARAFTQTLDVDTIIGNVYRYSSRLMDASNFHLALYHPGEDETEFKLYVREGEAVQPQEPRRKAGNGLTEWVIRNREPLLITEDVESWVYEMGLETKVQGAQTWLGVPMLRGDQVLGVIAVQSYTSPRHYSAHHLDLLSAVANQAAIAIQNARLFTQTQARARREQILREITARVHGSADAHSILRTVVQEIGNALGRPAFVYLGNPEDESEAEAAEEDPAPQPEDPAAGTSAD